NRFYAHLQRLPISFFARTTPGDLMSRAVNDMMSIRSFFGPALMNLVNTAVVYLTALSIMTWINPTLTLAALLPVPFLIVTVQKVSRRLYARSRRVQERLAELSNRVQENLSGIQLIKTYALEEREMANFNRLAGLYRQENLALARVRGALVPLMGSMGGASALIALWVGGRLVAAGTITLGEFVAFSGYLGMLVWPTVAMGWVINGFQRGLVAMNRLQEILRSPPETADRPADMSIASLGGGIEIRDLTLRHPGKETPVLEHLSLTIDAGEIVALVGPVGSGKSTIANILARFVPVPDCTVFMDGHDINRIPLEVLRRSIGYAPQEAFLFSRSMADNIAFGLDHPQPGEVEKAAMRAGLERDLAGFPEGLKTRVGEGGLTLSGGQRQRTALARAVAVAPRILILDDSLSSVDVDTERAVLKELGALMKDRTTLLISHRFATVTWADRIIVLKDGRVTESGTHDELLAAGGLYKNLFTRQASTTGPRERI
ncbi:MAG: ABC transporter ATP-binding protein, partial [Acidobacteriota bacterium]